MKSILCLCVVITLAGLNLASGCPASCICNYNEGSVHCKGREDFFNHTEIPDNFTSVVYEDCRLGTISDKLLYVHTVSLSIRNSGLSNINNEVFAGMTVLKTLDLRYNNLSAFSEDVFSGLDSLQDLYLSYNHFTTLLPNFFAHLPTLVHVQLDGNRGFQFSSSMFGNVENTSNLTHISCASCNIAEISAATEALSKVMTLRDLNLSSNRLTSLPPRIFEANQRLETLRLDNCLIKNVSEGSFAGLIHLRKLNLSTNEIQNLPTGLFDVSKKSLRFVFLDSNALTTLDENLLEWSSLSELQLENNPWTCDCDIEWLRQFQIDLTNVTYVYVCSNFSSCYVL